MKIKRVKLKIKISILLLAILTVLPGMARSAMQSNSYVIYDSVMHAFDGPVITGISVSVSGQTATVSWTTNVAANSFVEYDTSADFSSSKEQGTSVKNFTSHSVAVSGLEANTTYYYRVKSERVNGGITTETPSSNSFTTGNDNPPAPQQPETSTGGGGVLIIDKTDKFAPVIENVQAASDTDTGASVTWDTDEEATSFVEYGLTEDYGSTYGHWGTSTSHSVELINLEPETTYQFRVLSSDDWGNVAYSENFSFVTGQGEPGEEPEEPEEPEDLRNAAERALEWLQKIFPQVSLNNLGPDPLNDINTLEELNNFIPAPLLVGTPGIEVEATRAIITWTTDVAANSQVAMAPSDAYNPGADEPYQQVVGNTEIRTTAHEVTLYNLTPDTEYHFQLRSQGDIGPMARSNDYTFKTNLEELTITSLIPQVVDDQTANFKWVTNKAANTEISYAPYRGNTLAVDLSKTKKDNAQSVIHEITLDDLEGGTMYNIEIISRDENGNVARETLDRFSTSEDDNPPQISHIKTDSTVFLDRSNKTQTIISWLTNEPATSRIYYQEGVFGPTADLNDSTDLNTNYTKEHVVVVTKFKPGVVYTFRVESIDSGGNTVISKPHTFMTAKKSESIIQIILNILENTFGWLKDII